MAAGAPAAQAGAEAHQQPGPRPQRPGSPGRVEHRRVHDHQEQAAHPEAGQELHPPASPFPSRREQPAEDPADPRHPPRAQRQQRGREPQEHPSQQRAQRGEIVHDGLNIAPWRYLPRVTLWPSTATPDASRLLVTRALRGFADGLVSVLLAAHLGALGFSPSRIGAVLTGTMLGSAALTLAVGLRGHGWRRRTVLAGATALMAMTGLGLAGASGFWTILVVAVIGTMNPSAGDVSVFLPIQQAPPSDSVASPQRTSLVALYNLRGT